LSLSNRPLLVLAHDRQTATICEFDATKHTKAKRLDGCYLIKIDRKDLSGDELWRIYVLLTRAETAFRDMKSPLAERPIFHHSSGGVSLDRLAKLRF
jgi:hypothetical protein